MVSMHEPGSRVCQECPHQAGCSSAAYQLLDRLPDTPEVRTTRQQLAAVRAATADSPEGQGREVQRSKRGVLRIALTVAELAAIERLPAAVGARVKTLAERGWFAFARAELQAGRNPAPSGTMKVAMDALLAGGCTRKGLIQAFVTQLGIKPASAAVQASVLVSVLAFGKIAVDNYGKLVPTPNNN
jgi:hypothetical protein